MIEWHIGGSDLNTAVGLARLGVDVTCGSRLPVQVMAREDEGVLYVPKAGEMLYRLRKAIDS